jgi:hypothetical protein
MSTGVLSGFEKKFGSSTRLVSDQTKSQSRNLLKFLHAGQIIFYCLGIPTDTFRVDTACTVSIWKQRNSAKPLSVGSASRREAPKWERTGYRIVFAIRINFTGAKTPNHHPHACLLGFALRSFDLDNGATLTRETSLFAACEFDRS